VLFSDRCLWGFRAALATGWTAVLAALLAGCETRPPQPLLYPEESALFHTVDSGFRINAREGTVRYFLILEPRHNLEMPLRLVVEYDNPAQPEVPIRAEQFVEAGVDYVFLESEPLLGIKAGEVYRMQVHIFTPPDAEEPDDTHTVFIRSVITTHQ